MESPIRRLRMDLNMTQEQLAVMAGLTQSCISNVERGIVDLPERLVAALSSISQDIEDIQTRQRIYKERQRAAIKRLAKRRAKKQAKSEEQ